MSGANWAPRWALGGSEGDRRFRIVSGGRALPAAAGLRNWYADPAVVDAQERLAARRPLRSPAIQACGWALGNENSNCTLPPDRRAGEAWLERMSTALRRSDPGRPVTIGLHMEDLENDRLIGPAEAARFCDVVSMHGYPIYADWAAGPTDHELVAFLAEITRWLASGAPVLFEELGAPTVPAAAPKSGMLDEPAAALYTGRALDGLRNAGCIGAFLWCFSDYVSDLATVPPFDAAPHELGFGLWRADGTPKAAVAEVAARAGAACVTPPAREPGSTSTRRPSTKTGATISPPLRQIPRARRG